MSLSVLMFTPQFRPRVGGAERQVEKLSTALAKKGVRLRILTPRLDAASPALEVVDGVEILRFGMPLVALPFGLRGAGPINRWLIRRSVERAVTDAAESADVVHGHTACLATALALETAHRLGLPTACKLATAFPTSDLDILRGQPGGRDSVRRLVASVNRWVATSSAVVEALKKESLPAEAIAAIPNGVDVAPGVMHGRGPARRLLYLGRLSSNSERDVPALIAAFDLLADTRPDVELALVGGGDLAGKTQAAAAACRNRDRIHLPGIQPPGPWLTWADAFILPSLREGLSNALLEAMAAGLACVANDIPPNREALDDGAAGLLVPVGDVEALHAALASLADDAGRAETLRRAALKRVRSRYDIEAVAECCIALYQEMIEGRTQ